MVQFMTIQYQIQCRVHSKLFSVFLWKKKNASKFNPKKKKKSLIFYSQNLLIEATSDL